MSRLFDRKHPVARAAALVSFATIFCASATRPDELAPPALTPCGGCHMIYPAAMLTKRSWEAIIAGLDNHFGGSARLSAREKTAVLAYLDGHAADSPNAAARDRHFLSDLPSDPTPLRITRTRWWSEMHADFDFEAAKHRGVRSPADCLACHENGFE